MRKPKTHLTNIRLTEVEIKILREFAEREYEGNVSAANRKIIRDWDEMRKQNGNSKETTPSG